MKSLLDEFLVRHEKRIIGLDILRALAVLTIVWIHGGLLIPKEWRMRYYLMMPIYIDGVSIFFVLSGFLIGTILLRTMFTTALTGKDLLHFWRRRWFRTLPAYFLLLAILAAIQFFLAGNGGNFSWKFLFFLQNLTTNHPKAFEEAWSLSVEEWFYLILPVLVFLPFKISGKKTQSFAFALAMLLLLPLLLRFWQYEPTQSPIAFRQRVLYRLDGLGYGVLGAAMAWFNPNQFRKYRFHVLVLGILLYLGMMIYLVKNLSYSANPFFNCLEAITVLCFLPYLATLERTRFPLLNAVIIYISLISYSLYLTHSTAIRGYLIPWIDVQLGINNQPLDQHWFFHLCLYWMFSIVISSVLYRYFERPMTNLRDRYT